MTAPSKIQPSDGWGNVSARSVVTAGTVAVGDVVGLKDSGDDPILTAKDQRHPAATATLNGSGGQVARTGTTSGFRVAATSTGRFDDYAAYDVAMNAVRSREDLRHFLAEDMRANGVQQWRWPLRFVRPQLHFQRLLRRAEFWQNKAGMGRLIYAIYRFRQARAGQRIGLSIPPGVFGPGLSIPHYGTIVVHNEARFGANCRVHTSTNIGRRNGKAPQGGNDIYIAPGAVLFGDITIGDGALIAANAVVSDHVPAGVTVAGAPARVVNASQGSESIMPNRGREI